MPRQKRRHWKSVESRLHFAKPYVDGFESWLQDHGYTPSTINEQVRLLAGWTNWMHAARFTLDNVLNGFTASAAVFKGKKSIRAYAGAGRLFIRYLQDQGTLPRSVPLPAPEEQWPILGAFRTWARQHRGIAHSTLNLWQRSIIDLVKALGEDPQAYTQRRCASSCWSGRSTTKSRGLRPMRSRSAASSASLWPPGDALRAVNTPFPPLPTGSLRPFPGISLRKMSSVQLPPAMANAASAQGRCALARPLGATGE
jgi:hypothetical protein